MRSTPSRSGFALFAALSAAVLLSPTLPAWADNDIELPDIGTVKRGEKSVNVRVDVRKSDLICSMKLKYADGNVDSPDDVLSDKKGICTFTFDAPDRKAAVGDAIAKLKVETKKGSDQGKASRGFFVRERRGG